MGGQISRENGKKGGRPKGSLNKLTLEKRKIKEEYQKKVMQAAEPLFASQLHLATGQKFLFKIRKKPILKKGKVTGYAPLPPKLVTDPVEIEHFLLRLIGQEELEKGPGATYYFITTKEPNVNAIRDMLDRTFDKASQPIKGEGEGGAIEVNVNEISFRGYGKASNKSKARRK